MDWAQIWEITSTPDNIPIVMLIVMAPFFTWLGWRQARANDRLIDELARDPEKAKTHHRKTDPWKKGWEPTVYVWPYLLKIELLATVIVTIILVVWSVGLDAPLEEPANPNLTMNPAKAPWYFLGLQEMLVYFDPWIAGVVLPTLIIMGLMVIPYCDNNAFGNGYYTVKQRKYAYGVFFFGFYLWVALIFIGVFVRGPGWMWFWPGETWDHHRLVYEVNRNLHEILGVANPSPNDLGTYLLPGIIGGLATVFYFAAGGALIHWLYTKWKPADYARMNLFQYATMQIFLLSMFSLPAKMVARLVFRIKYIWVTPWFNI